VTCRLRTIANLDDLSEIRNSLESSAAELKTSIERMTEEGKAAIDQLRTEMATFQTKLEEAQQVASVDSLTGLRSRLCVEKHINQKISARGKFCAALMDIDHFKKVNDEHGHLAGDELLQQFARELKSRCRSGDVVGRWGGDEFLVLLDCGLPEAEGRTARLAEWVCGNYTVQGRSGPVKLKVNASMGLAEYKPDETQKELLARADKAMYRDKMAGH
jgi:diguanylate cyclase (GGDEF)-like protein